MRRPTSALASAVLGTALAASTVSAQQPVPSPNYGPGTSAAASAPVTDPMTDPSAHPMNPSRGARYLLRNGWDYINYQEYERALAFFREAERRQGEMSDPERLRLKQGIERAQRGLYEAANGSTEPSYARSGRLNRPGALALAAPAAANARPVPGAPRIEREPIQLASVPAAGPLSNPNAANIRAAATSIAVPVPTPVAVPVAVAMTPAPIPPTPEIESAPVSLPAPEPIVTTPSPVAEAPVVTFAPAPAAVVPVPVPAATMPVPVPELPPPPHDEPLATLPAEPAQAPVPTTEPAPIPAQAPTPVPIPVPEPEPAPAPPPAVDSAADVEKLPPLPEGVLETTRPVPEAVRAPVEAPAPAVAASPAGMPPVVGLPASAVEDIVPAPAPAAVAVPDAPPPPLDAGPSPAAPMPALAPDAAIPPARLAVEPQRRFNPDSFLPGPRKPHISTLSDEDKLEVERIAQRQEDDFKRNSAPGMAPLPGDPESPVGPGGSASTKLEISRAPSSTEARPIRAIPVPEEFVPLPKREWKPDRKYWAAAATCHLPLYFQDASLERYGYSMEQRFGSVGRFLSYPLDDPRQSKQRNQIIQPLFSIGLFAAQIALLPYNMIMDPPWEAEYDLGYYRPGDRVPTDVYYLPLTGVGPPLRGLNYGLPARKGPALPGPRW